MIVRPYYRELLSDEVLLNDVFMPTITVEDNSRILHTSINVKYRSKDFQFYIDIPEGYYIGAKKSDKILSYVKSRHIPDKVRIQMLYESFVFEKNQLDFYNKIITGFKKIKIENRMSDDEYFELIVKYVQQLPYRVTESPNPKYPIETVTDNIGDCDDRSILLASLVACSGYSVALLAFDDMQHMAVGIPAAKGYDYNGCGYALIETTSELYINEIPIGYNRMDASLYLNPIVYPIGTGKIQYGQLMSSSVLSSIKKYLRQILSELSGKPFLSVSEANRYNKMVEAYNSLDSKKNSVQDAMNMIKKANIPEINDILKSYGII